LLCKPSGQGYQAAPLCEVPWKIRRICTGLARQEPRDGAQNS